MKKIENEFVTYDLALRLKLLGYDEPCFGYFTKHRHFINDEIESQEGNSDIVSRPTWQSAFSWFRDKHNLYTKPNWCWTGFTQFFKFEVWEMRGNVGRLSKGIDIFRDGNKFKGEDPQFYEKAQKACLEMMCEILEKRGS